MNITVIGIKIQTYLFIYLNFSANAIMLHGNKVTLKTCRSTTQITHNRRDICHCIYLIDS